MKILYHHRTRSTDAQRIHIQEIVRAFEELGHEVELVSLVPTDTDESNAARDAGEAGWKTAIRRIPGAYDIVQLGYNAVGLPMLVRHLMRAGRVDFIYERYSLFNFAGVWAARLFNIPLILEVNSPFALEQQRDNDIQFARFAQWTERTICNLASRVIVVSTPLARIMAELGVNPKKLEVMPNGVAAERFEPRPPDAELRGKLGLSGKRVVGFVGWFRQWHGLEMLLQAFHEGGLANENAALLLVGDGPAMPGLKEYVAKHGLEKSVIFTGPVPHAEVPGYLSQIDIAVQPAANEYCCPMKILEYMALAKPIVAPAQENVTELLTPSEAVFFTPQDVGSLIDALRQLVRNEKLTAQMGASSREALTRRGLLWTSNAARVIAMVQEEKLPVNELTKSSVSHL